MTFWKRKICRDGKHISGYDLIFRKCLIINGHEGTWGWVAIELFYTTVTKAGRTYRIGKELLDYNRLD